MLELAILIVLVWVVGPVVALLCAMGLVFILVVLALGGLAAGVIWGTTAIFGPAAGIPVGVACLVLLFVGWKYADWRSEQRDGAAKGPGAWGRYLVSETPIPEVVL